MKNNRTLLLIFAALAAATAIFVMRKSDTTIREELKDFAVKDTASITKIFLADKSGNEILLERKDKSMWILNGKDEPKKDFLKLLMDGIYGVQIKTKVANAAYNNVIKMLASTGVKCEIYLNHETKPAKVYYVGGQTEDALGTFMMIENSSAPFVTEVPGFNGYLTPRYNTSIDAWKSTKFISISPDDIAEVSIKYAAYPEKSFKIRSGNGKYVVESISTGKQIEKVDSVAVENYLSFYKNVYYESSARSLASATKDSMLQYPPSISLSVKDKKNVMKEVDIYPMPISSTSLTLNDSLGNKLKFDLDRMYGLLKPENELVVLQHYTFDVLLRQLSDFDATHRK